MSKQSEKELCDCKSYKDKFFVEAGCKIHASPTLEDKEKAEWLKFLNKNDLYGSLYTEKFVEYWLERLRSARKEGFKSGIKNAECQCAVHVELARAAAFKEASQYKNDKLLQEVQDAHEAGRESALEEIIPKILKLKDCKYANAYDEAIDELIVFLSPHNL